MVHLAIAGNYIYTVAAKIDRTADIFLFFSLLFDKGTPQRAGVFTVVFAIISSL
jgi:hypothetical protein